MNTKKTSFIGLCLLAAAVSTTPASADELGQVKVTIPFAFHAGSVSLPAGEYRVIEENAGGLMLIAGRAGSAMFVTAPGQAQGISTPSELKFQKTGQDAVLTEIRMSGAPSHILPVAGNSR